jgi:hypothetical protein
VTENFDLNEREADEHGIKYDASKQAIEQAEPGNGEGRAKDNVLEAGPERQYQRPPKAARGR